MKVGQFLFVWRYIHEETTAIPRPQASAGNTVPFAPAAGIDEQVPEEGQLEKNKAICTIYRLPADYKQGVTKVKLDDLDIVGSASIKRHHNDAPNRVLARKNVLGKALHKAFPRDNNYTFRKEVWETYRNLTQTPRW